MINEVYSYQDTAETHCNQTVKDSDEIKAKVLNWIRQFSTFCFLDNHRYASDKSRVEILAAAGARETVSGNADDILRVFQDKMEREKDWWFGHLSYDLNSPAGNRTEKASPRAGNTFTKLSFFKPAVRIRINGTSVTVDSAAGDAGLVLKDILNTPVPSPSPGVNNISVQNRVSREEYIRVINRLRQHILRGDCYEINYCQEFYAENAVIDPVEIYSRLSRSSPNPFSALYRINDQYLVCASPERFLQKSGRKICSQPMKGTSTRFPADPDKDGISKKELQESSKDRSENVMVVDLVRNDLSQVCVEGSVSVDELFGVYTFPQVYQMVSTVSGILREGVRFSDIIRAAFPMGSMTGAPKKRVMELIAQYEKTDRGLFSGSLGYITPEGDFDFNVVIRSLMYNASEGYLSFPAGSGITFYSDAEKEYEECLLKAAAIQKILAG